MTCLQDKIVLIRLKIEQKHAIKTKQLTKQLIKSIFVYMERHKIPNIFKSFELSRGKYTSFVVCLFIAFVGFTMLMPQRSSIKIILTKNLNKLTANNAKWMHEKRVFDS